MDDANQTLMQGLIFEQLMKLRESEGTAPDGDDGAPDFGDLTAAIINLNRLKQKDRELSLNERRIAILEKKRPSLTNCRPRPTNAAACPLKPFPTLSASSGSCDDKTSSSPCPRIPRQGQEHPRRDVFLLHYQSIVGARQSLLRIMEKARRIGISYSTAYDLVREHSLKETTQSTWVSSRDEPTAGLFVQDCRKFTRVMKGAAQDLGMR